VLKGSSYVRWSSITMDFLLGLFIEASGKQGMVVSYVDNRDIDPFVTRLDPCASSLPLKDQFALREWRAAFALEEHVLKRYGSALNGTLFGKT
jgi:hypothetical protein